MVQRRDTQENAWGGRSYPSPSNMKRIGNGLRFVALPINPNDKTAGVPTQDWKSVHVIFYADETLYTGLFATFRPWRWYSKQPEGQSGATNVEVGRWIPDALVTVALDPAMVTAAISSHYTWPTRDAEKMYFQLVSVFDAKNVAQAIPGFVMAAPFGDADQNSTAVTAVVSVSAAGAGANPCCPPEFTRLASVGATYSSPVDGTAVFATAATLNCVFPFVVDDGNCQILGLVVRQISGAIVEYINGHNGVSFTAAAGVVTAVGCAAFVNTDVFFLYIRYQEKAYTEASDSYRTEEIQPLNDEITQPAIVVNLQAVAVDPGVSYAPSVDGIVMDGYKDIAFQLYLLGGIGAAVANRTVTVTFEGSNDVEVPAGTRQWAALGVGYDLVNDVRMASWTSVGNTPLVTQIDFDNWQHKRIRVKYDWDADPSVTNGKIVITERRKAL